jgi:hypothetical protein
MEQTFRFHPACMDTLLLNPSYHRLQLQLGFIQLTPCLLNHIDLIANLTEKTLKVGFSIG